MIVDPNFLVPGKNTARGIFPAGQGDARQIAVISGKGGGTDPAEGRTGKREAVDFKSIFLTGDPRPKDQAPVPKKAAQRDPGEAEANASKEDLEASPADAPAPADLPEIHDRSAKNHSASYPDVQTSNDVPSGRSDRQMHRPDGSDQSPMTQKAAPTEPAPLLMAGGAKTLNPGQYGPQATDVWAARNPQSVKRAPERITDAFASNNAKPIQDTGGGAEAVDQPDLQSNRQAEPKTVLQDRSSEPATPNSMKNEAEIQSGQMLHAPNPERPRGLTAQNGRADQTNRNDWRRTSLVSGSRAEVHSDTPRPQGTERSSRAPIAQDQATGRSDLAAASMDVVSNAPKQPAEHPHAVGFAEVDTKTSRQIPEESMMSQGSGQVPTTLGDPAATRNAADKNQAGEPLQASVMRRGTRPNTGQLNTGQAPRATAAKAEQIPNGGLADGRRAIVQEPGPRSPMDTKPVNLSDAGKETATRGLGLSGDQPKPQTSQGIQTAEKQALTEKAPVRGGEAPEAQTRGEVRAVQNGDATLRGHRTSSDRPGLNMGTGASKTHVEGLRSSEGSASAALQDVGDETRRANADPKVSGKPEALPDAKGQTAAPMAQLLRGVSDDRRQLEPHARGEDQKTRVASDSHAPQKQRTQAGETLTGQPAATTAPVSAQSRPPASTDIQPVSDRQGGAEAPKPETPAKTQATQSMMSAAQTPMAQLEQPRAVRLGRYDDSRPAQGVASSRSEALKLVQPEVESAPKPQMPPAMVPEVEPRQVAGEQPAPEAIREPGSSTTVHQAARNHVFQMPDTAQRVTDQMVQVARNMQSGAVEIALNPEELGRVRMQLVAGETGLTMTVVADRPETLDLIRRNIEQLAQEFRALGYQSLDLSFGGNSPGQDQRTPQTNHTFQTTGPQAPDHARSPLVTSSGMDIRL